MPGGEGGDVVGVKYLISKQKTKKGGREGEGGGTMKEDIKHYNTEKPNKTRNHNLIGSFRRQKARGKYSGSGGKMAKEEKERNETGKNQNQRAPVLRKHRHPSKKTTERGESEEKKKQNLKTTGIIPEEQNALRRGTTSGYKKVRGKDSGKAVLHTQDNCSP